MSELDYVCLLACCLPSGNARLPTGAPSVDVEEMGTTASSMPGAGLYEPHDHMHERGKQVRAGPCLLLAVGQCAIVDVRALGRL
jgi:hypothetical protein